MIRREFSVSTVRWSLAAATVTALLNWGGVARAGCFQCTKDGTQALSGSTGVSESAFGYQAMSAGPDSGGDNAALGFTALYSNTAGGSNTAVGASALYSNNEGSDNTAVGSVALLNNTNGVSNTAVGYTALASNTSGVDNVAIGDHALSKNTSGGVNIAIGAGAGSLLTTGSGNIDIGNSGVAGESTTIRIGSEGASAAYMAGIYGAGVLGFNATQVFVDSTGKLGTVLVLPSAVSPSGGSAPLSPSPRLLFAELQKQTKQFRSLPADVRAKSARIATLERRVASQQREIDALEKKDAQLVALVERINTLEREVRASRPERVAAMTR